MAGQLEQPIRIKDQNFIFGVEMYNFEGEPRTIPVNTISNLHIEEDLWANNITGHIELQSFQEFIERGYGNEEGFFIRTDGFARLKISIKMVDNDGHETVINKPQNHWVKSYDLVIIHVEDLYSENQNEAEDSFVKSRRFYFEDEGIHRLKMINLEWSTDQYRPKVPYDDGYIFEAKYGWPDEKHTMLASDALKSVLKTAGSSNQDPRSPDVCIGSGPFMKSNKANYLLGKIDNENWFRTDLSLSKLKFVNPNNSSAYNAIAYILSHAVDRAGYPCVLTRGFTHDEKQAGWKLETLFKIMNENKDMLAEKFYITESDQPTEGYDNYDPGSTAEERSDGQNTHTPKPTEKILKYFSDHNSSHIKQYSYSPAGAHTTNLCTNRPTSIYDFRSHSLKTYQALADAKTNYDYTTKEGEKLYSRGQHLLISNNYINMSGHSVLYSTTPRSFFPETLSKNMYLWTVITNSSKITFEVPGVLFRRPRLWFSINRDSATSRNNYLDYKLLGEWLCTRVIHKFGGNNEYKTIVEGSRMDMWKSAPKTKPDEARRVGLK